MGTVTFLDIPPLLQHHNLLQVVLQHLQKNNLLNFLMRPSFGPSCPSFDPNLVHLLMTCHTGSASRKQRPTSSSPSPVGSCWISCRVDFSKTVGGRSIQTLEFPKTQFNSYYLNRNVRSIYIYMWIRSYITSQGINEAVRINNRIKNQSITKSAASSSASSAISKPAGVDAGHSE